MERYLYRVLDEAGNLKKGALEAQSAEEVLEQLERSGLIPISVQPAGRSSAANGWQAWLRPEPSPEPVTDFTTDLAMLLKGGIFLGEALAISAQLERRRWLRELIRTIRGDIASGSSFSEALVKHPQYFSPIYVETVTVAEASGQLADALAGIAAERQRIAAMRKRFISAISYPLFLFCAALTVLCFVLLYIIPQFEVAIASFRDRMDASTVFVFDLSAALRENVRIILAVLAGLLGIAVVVNKVADERGLWIALLSRLPLTGQLLEYELTVKFCRTLAVLTRYDVDISTALRLVRGIVRTRASANKIDTVLADVRQGRRLTDALETAKLMPPHVAQLIRVGEETGDIAGAATRVAEFYESKLEATLKRLTAIIGPVLMITVSLLIAWVIISVMSALISINDLLL